MVKTVLQSTQWRILMVKVSEMNAVRQDPAGRVGTKHVVTTQQLMGLLLSASCCEYRGPLVRCDGFHRWSEWFVWKIRGDLPLN